MKWTQRDDWHWERECGRYTVSRSLTFADPRARHGKWVYLAWAKSSRSGEPAECLSPKARDSLQAAIEDCAPHLRQRKAQLNAA